MSNPKILAVDDSRTMRNMLKKSLREAGFSVVLAEDGADGLKQLSIARPDVILTDINMPNMDGFEFVEQVRNRNELRGVPILILTTESDQKLRDRARHIGATGWIVKPFDDESLISAILRVAAR